MEDGAQKMKESIETMEDNAKKISELQVREAQAMLGIGRRRCNFGFKCNKNESLDRWISWMR